MNRIGTSTLSNYLRSCFQHLGGNVIRTGGFLDFSLLITVRISASFGASVLILKGVIFRWGSSAGCWLVAFTLTLRRFRK